MAARPKLRDLDLNLLVLFDALMSTRQLTAAAGRLSITQSAASQALARLRRAFDDELFVRSRNGMVPTPKAQELAPYVSEALMLVDKALQETSEFDPATSRRTFRIAFGSTGEIALLPRILGAVASQSTAVKIVSTPATSEQALALVKRADIDFSVDYAAPRDRRLQHEKMAEDEIVLIARRGHPRIRGSVTTEEFFRERHVVLSLDDERRAYIERLIQHGGSGRQIIAEVGHYASVPALVLETDAIAIIPRSMAEILLYKDRFQVVATPFALPSLPLFVIWHSAFETDPAHRWMRGIILGALTAARTP